MITKALAKVIDRKDLTEDEAAAVMADIMEGKASDAQIGALLTGLRMKGESEGEVTGFARTMRSKAAEVRPVAHPLVDTCGTGGDLAGTFNISTTAAFVVAGAGASIAKHGNRSVSSKSGSADVLEALGVAIDLGPEQVARCIDDVGIGFLFAPRMHQAMKYVGGPRREMGVRTVFNILGPLTNPAGAGHQLVGVFSDELVEFIAGVLARLGTKHAMVVHGEPGLDEMSTVGDTYVAEARDGDVRAYRLSPDEFDLAPATLEDIVGGGPEQNAAITRAVLSGESGPARDIVLFNAAAALVAADVAADVAEGLVAASDSVDSGAASDRLDALAKLSRKLAAEGGA
jgi:anthranilate phosphoribosyltransferase